MQLDLLDCLMAAAGSVRPGRALVWQLLLLLLLQTVVPAQFLPSGIPAVAAGVTQRLVFRQQGFVENWLDPSVSASQRQLLACGQGCL
jgi:hypothetical protein